MQHFIDAADMTAAEWDGLYRLYRDVRGNPNAYREALRGKVMASLFFEPSTRTSFSFQSAMMKLGGSVFGFADANTSSVSKGEKIKDTIIMCSTYADAVVIRTPWEGAARAASLYSYAPVINAGDGGHLHPTQTLTDLCAMTDCRGGLNNMNIGLCGDLLNGRTVHSLVSALTRYEGVRFFLISPRRLKAPSYVTDLLKKSGHWYIETTGLEAVLPQLDVLYMTRIQRERFANPNEYYRLKNTYVLNAQKLKLARPGLQVLHPLPRVDEIALDVDGDERAWYFRQAECGLYVRMALLLTLMGEAPRRPEHLPPETRQQLCTNPRCITKSETYLPILDEGGKCGYCDDALT